jgi:hypothetical protein
MKDAVDFIDWKELKGKEARGVEKKVDLGEVQGVGRNYVITKKGIANKETFYIPKYLAQGFDGKRLFFNVTEGQKAEFMRNSPPTYEEYFNKYKLTETRSDIEDKLVVVDETPVVLGDEPLEEAVVKTTTVIEPVTKSRTMTREEPPVIKWENTIHKGVRTMDGEPLGNVVALYPDSIHIETEGSKAGYEIPKEEVAAFNGAEVRLKVPIADMAQFQQHKH